MGKFLPKIEHCFQINLTWGNTHYYVFQNHTLDAAAHRSAELLGNG